MPVACVACEETNTPAAREETDTPVARETESVGAVALLLKYFGHNVLLDELRNGGTLEPACAADVSAGEAGGGGAHDGALRALPQNGHDLDVLYSEHNVPTTVYATLPQDVATALLPVKKQDVATAPLLVEDATLVQPRDVQPRDVALRTGAHDDVALRAGAASLAEDTTPLAEDATLLEARVGAVLVTCDGFGPTEEDFVRLPVVVRDVLLDTVLAATVTALGSFVPTDTVLAETVAALGSSVPTDTVPAATVTALGSFVLTSTVSLATVATAGDTHTAGSTAGDDVIHVHAAASTAGYGVFDGSSLVVSPHTLGGEARLHAAAAIASVCMGALSLHSQHAASGATRLQHDGSGVTLLIATDGVASVRATSGATLQIGRAHV